MARIGELIEIKKDSFFNGAVQAEWFYNSNKRDDVAKSYIFHGPKYYGVSQKDITSSNHKLCDTVTFTKAIYNKIYKETNSNRFVLTIAGYGAGKSHLTLALATLMSNINDKERNDVLQNIKNADKEGYDYINQFSSDKHLVLVLNGINDFNLNMEVLKVAKESLRLHGLNDEIFKDMTNAYRTAKNYLENSFEYLSEQYMEKAKKYKKFKNYSDKNKLKEVLLNSIEDYDSYSLVSEIYKSQTGNEINITEGISSGYVLSKLNEEYVVKNKIFKSIVVLFDEFGRYLEFASSQPYLAGETGIQQIFEAVQNASPNIVFIGFIQSELNAYIARVNNDSIMRYVGRYQNSDKYYLSSNLETVLANIIKKKNNADKIIDTMVETSMNKFAMIIHSNIGRWLPELTQKSVWNNFQMFKNTILKGGFPIHPLTISMFSTLSVYMQQRSMLTFLSDIFDSYKDIEFNDYKDLIYPIVIVNSSIFEELLNAEQRGRVSGDYCSQYKEIIESNEDILVQREKNILSAILLININKFKVFDKNDIISIIRDLTGLDEQGIIESINKLENNLGLIYYDETIKKYKFLSDGNSKADYNKLFKKKKLTVNTKEFITDFPEELKKELKIGISELTLFGRLNNINTNEWSYIKEFIDINDCDYNFLKNLKNNVQSLIHPDESRIRVIYLYCNKESYEKIQLVASYMKELNYEECVILVGIIYDLNNIIQDSLINIRTLNSFNQLEKEKFKKFYEKSIVDENKKIIKEFMNCAKQRKFIKENEIYVSDKLLKDEIMDKLNNIYPKVIPFSIDGFEKKINAKARKYYYSIIEALLFGKIEDIVEFETLPVDIRNRINCMFSVNSEKGWKVLYNGNYLGEPLNPKVKEIFLQIKSKILSKEKISFNTIIQEYVKAPYGLSIYSISLLIVYIVVVNKDNLIISYGIIKSKVQDIYNCFNDDKKEKFKEFAKYYMQYTEESESDKIVSLIEKIEKMRNSTIDNVESLYNDLKKIDLSELNSDIRGRYLNCEDILKIAVNRNEEINKKINSAYDMLEKINENPFIIRNILIICNEIKNDEIKGLTYRYSLEQVNKATDIKNKGINLFKNSINSFAKTASINNFKEINNRMKNLIALFQKLEIQVDLIEETEKSQEYYKKRYLNAIEIKKELDKIEKDFYKIKSNVDSVKNLDESEEKINEWLSVEPKYVRYNTEIFKNINELKDKIIKIKDDSNKVLQQSENLINNIYNLDDLSNAIYLFNDILKKSLLSNVHDKLEKINNILFNIDRTLQKYKFQKYTRIEIDEAISILKNEYKDNFNITNMISNIKSSLLDKCDKLDKDWNTMYYEKIKNIDKMNVEELKKMKSNASKDEEYLSDENKEKYKILKKKIDVALGKYKIDNIISMFDELSQDEKAICIDRLKSNFKEI